MLLPRMGSSQCHILGRLTEERATCVVREASSGEGFPKECTNTRGEGSLARANTTGETVTIPILTLILRTPTPTPNLTPTMNTTTITITMAWAWAITTVARVATTTLATLNMIGVTLMLSTLPRLHLVNHLVDICWGNHLLAVNTVDPPATHQSHLSEALIKGSAVPQRAMKAMRAVWVDTAIKVTDLWITQRTVSNTLERGGPVNPLALTALAVVGRVGATGSAVSQGLGIAIKLTALGVTIMTAMSFFPLVEAFLRYSRNSSRFLSAIIRANPPTHLLTPRPKPIPSL